MRKVLLAGLWFAAVITAESAPAADFGPPPAYPSYYPPVRSWTGCYVGPQIGGILDGGSGGGLGIGLLAGGQFGCNYQSGHVVVGLESEGVWSNTIAHSDKASSGPFASSSFNSTKNPWDADIAVRTGFLFRDDVLTYLKVGASFAQFGYSSTASNFLGITTTTGSATMSGLLLASGLELMITPQWLARGELDLVLHNPTDVTMTCVPAAFCLSTSSLSTQTEVQFGGKVGISYLFW